MTSSATSENSKKTVRTLIFSHHIVPIEPANTVLENHAIAIANDGTILDLLPQAEATEKYLQSQTQQPQPELVQLNHHVLIPGLVNAHTHASMSLFRGKADDLPLMEWLQEHIWPAEGACVDAKFVRDGTQLAIAEMIRSGTTTFNEMYFFPEAVAEVAQETGMRVLLGLIMINNPTRWGEGPDEYFRKWQPLIERYKTNAADNDTPTVHLALAPHAPYSVADKPLQRICALSAEHNFPVHMHVHESAFEVADAEEHGGMRPLQRLHQLGLVNDKLAAVHMTQLTDEEISFLAERNANVVHCPESNMKLANGICPAQKLLDAGVNVALGTDGAASNNDLNLLGEMRTAALLAKLHTGDASALNDWKALEMATINGARALSLADKIGSIVPGKSADLTAIRLDELETAPLYDVVSHLVYAVSRNQVSDVWVEGKSLLRNRKLQTLNSQDLLEKAEKWREKILKNCGQ